LRKFIARIEGIGIVRETDVDFGPIETAPTDMLMLIEIEMLDGEVMRSLFVFSAS